MNSRRLLAIAVAVGLFVAYAVLSVGSHSTAAEDVTGSASTETSVAIADDADTEAATARFSGLPTLDLFELSPEALDTLDLIDLGGPYPFDRDDLVFQNREGILPDRTRGHYREYTVITPGENDRGARRIVAGEDGERYYTADHYSSFSEIVFDTR